MRRFSVLSFISLRRLLPASTAFCLGCAQLVCVAQTSRPSAPRSRLVNEVLAVKNYMAAFLTKEQATAAYSHTTKLIDGGSTDWAVYYVRAQALRALKKPEEAMADAKRSSALDGKEYFPVRLRGLIANDLLEDSEAIRYYTLAMKMAPHERADLLDVRYRSYEKAGLIKEANGDLVELLKNNPQRNDDDKQRSLGKFAMRLGNPAGAVQFFSQALKMRPTLPKVHCFRGDAYMMLKNYQAAIADYSFELTRDSIPQEEVLHRRAMAYKLAGDTTHARLDEVNEKKLNAETYENMPFSN